MVHLPLRKKTLLEEMGVTKKHLLPSLSMSIMVTAFGLVLLTLYGIATRTLNFSSFDLGYFAYYALLSAPAQELFFRGFVQSKLYKLGNPLFAIIITAVVFSLVHFYYGIHLTLFTFPVGLVWSLMMWRRPNILGPILSHIILGQFIFQFIL